MVNPKKAILLVSVGTANKDARANTLLGIEREVQEAYKDYSVRQAFTSKHLLKLVWERFGIELDTPEKALEKLGREGFGEIVIQPLHFMPGAEFHELVKVISDFGQRHVFSNIRLGRCLLHYMGDGERFPDDFGRFAEVLIDEYSNRGNILFAGHGTAHPSNAVYSCLGTQLARKGKGNLYIGTLMSYPSINDAMTDMESDGVKEVTIAPLMIVAGNHILNDVASDREGSWKSILRERGFVVDTIFQGIGDLKGVRRIVVANIKDAIDGRY